MVEICNCEPAVYGAVNGARITEVAPPAGFWAIYAYQPAATALFCLHDIFTPDNQRNKFKCVIHHRAINEHGDEYGIA
ncbi:hypothetical protein SOASR029_27840 [Budvicia aquatica]|nr:hypothetical protein SOASR029_27840 [Budvicia aquatica]